jgi:two-component system phosphate regulon sensor histidine kinase PhoR
MKIWYFFSAVLLLVIVFFGYTQFVILKQRRLSEIQKDFVNNMTHEFKTPVTSLQISADVMAKASIHNDKERLSKYATIIKEQSNQLLSHIDKILQVTSLVPKKTKLEKSPMGIIDVVGEIVEQFRENAKNTAVKFNFPDKEIVILADRIHFINIVYNLLDNAIKYSPPNSLINVNLLLTRNTVKLIVEDTGNGIAPLHQKKVFQKFYRVPVGNLHDVKGFGLGLFYVKSIIKAHGWNIHLKSKVNKGSSFTINIPTYKNTSHEKQ